MNYRNVQDALATKGISLRRGHIMVDQFKAIEAYVLDNGKEPLYLPMIDYDLIDVYHKGLRLN